MILFVVNYLNNNVYENIKRPFQAFDWLYISN